MTNEEAIEILEERWRYSKTYKYTDAEIREAFDMAIEALKHSEKFQQKAEVVISQLRADRDRLEEAHRWIPCEKRLPDKLQDVLVTFYDAEGEYDIAYMRKTFNASYKAQGIENEWVSSMGETTYADYEVVAWKPIEPYTAESEGA